MIQTDVLQAGLLRVGSARLFWSFKETDCDGRRGEKA